MDSLARLMSIGYWTPGRIVPSNCWVYTVAIFLWLLSGYPLVPIAIA